MKSLYDSSDRRRCGLGGGLLMLTAWRWDFSTIKECPNPRMLDLNRIRVSLQGGTGGDEEVCGDVVGCPKDFVPISWGERMVAFHQKSIRHVTIPPPDQTTPRIQRYHSQAFRSTRYSDNQARTLHSIQRNPATSEKLHPHSQRSPHPLPCQHSPLDPSTLPP